MTRGATLAGYVVIVLVMAVYDWRARRSARRATLGQLIGALAVRMPTRGLLLVAWLWLGWHLFART